MADILKIHRWIMTLLILGSMPLLCQGADLGSVSVHPDVGVSGEYGTWTVTYEVGEAGLLEGGAIRVQLPDAWHAGDRNSANPLQATRPTADHYISARCSREDVKLETIVEDESHRPLIKNARKGLDHRDERYVYVVRVVVQQGNLKPGDRLEIIYGDTSQGSRGMRASDIVTSPEPILGAIDTEGNGEFTIHPDSPNIRARSGPPATLLVTGPSITVVNQPAILQIALIDANENPVDEFQGDIRFDIVQGTADLPDTIQLDMAEGWTSISFTPEKTGILRIKAAALDGLYPAKVNPIKVVASEPKQNIYWGELHSHSKYSWDGVGSNNFEYARHVSMLDFYAMTDHSIPSRDGYTRGLYNHVWEEYTALTEQHHDPGEFVTLHAYEASFGAPYGHHNVFFRGKPGPLLAPANVTLPELWDALTAGEALTIPHHTGKFPRPVEWEPHNPEFRRNIEIYSAHGLSEAYDPEHPLAFEQSKFTSPSRSAEGPQYAQDAWEAEIHLSTVAASDDHRSQPGKPGWGLTAVHASELSRADIFDALYQRRTYGTTGSRILLDFTINGQPMGQRIVTANQPQLFIEAHGTDHIEWIEVLRHSESSGGFEVIFRMQPGGLDVTWNTVDQTFRDDSIYYVRLKQQGEIRDRIIMAWSSPIWVTKSKN